MLPQVFQSVPIDYQPQDLTRPPPEAIIQYHPELRTPPRIYDETMAWAGGLWVKQERTGFSEIVVYASFAIYKVAWPGWGFVVERFDGTTGEYLGRFVRNTAAIGGGGIGLTTRYIARSPNGELWSVGHGSLFIERLDPETLLATGERYGWEYFGHTGIHRVIVDRAQDLFILRLYNTPPSAISIYRMSTGEKLREIFVAGGDIEDIFYEDATRVYAIAKNGLLTLVDYVSGEVLGVMRQKLQPGIESFATSWDPYLRRILFFEQTPDNTDGSATSRIRGYYPVPIAVGLQTPVPLQVARRGRTVPVLTRAYGDTGDPITGLNLTRSYTGPGVILLDRRDTDGRGRAFFDCRCDGPGTESVTVSTEV
jgi:hypothetical protein